MKKIILIFIATIVVMLNTCSDNPVNPGDNVPPGRRDYVWTVDTLKAPAGNIFYLWKIWGCDTSAIWIAGQGDTPYNLWFFDGISWNPYSQIVNGSFGSIYGFSESDIWVTGVNVIYKFNGTVWKEINNFPYPSVYLTGLNDIWGINNKNIYVVGGATKDASGQSYFGVIFHFDGSVWTHINIPKERIGFNSVRQDKYDSAFLLSGTRFENSWRY